MAQSRLSDQKFREVIKALLALRGADDVRLLINNSGLSVAELMINAIKFRITIEDRKLPRRDEDALSRIWPALLSYDPSAVFACDEYGNNILAHLCPARHWSTRIPKDVIPYSGSEIQLTGMCSLAHTFIEHAHQSGELRKFITMRNKKGASIIDIAVGDNNLDMLWCLLVILGPQLEEFLFTQDDVSDNANMENMILTHYQLQEKISILSSKPKPDKFTGRIYGYYLDLLQKYLKPLPWHLNVKTHTLPFCLSELYGSRKTYTPVQRSIAKIMVKFHHRLDLIPYLDYIGTEYSRYYQETFNRPIPKLPRDQYDFKSVGVYPFPIPNERFKGISKNSALQEFFMVLLWKTAGWGAENMSTAIKWLGYIPSDKANQFLTTPTGTFFVEGRINESLFHGKLTHMIDFVLISLLILDGQLEPGVTLHDIARELVTATAADGAPLWMDLLDKGYFQTTYCNPYMLHSSMMRECRPALIPIADFLIDSFCKGYLKLIKDRELSSDGFLQKNRDKKLSQFEVSSDLVQKHLAARPAGVVTDRGEKFAVIEKTYKPNISFEPTIFKRKQPCSKPTSTSITTPKLY